MAHKRIIITASQLNEVMDNEKTKVQFTGTNASDLGKNAQAKYDDAIRSGLRPNAIQMDGKTSANNAADKEETVIGFDTTQGNLANAVTSAVNNAVRNGADINKINVVGNSEDILNGLGESKIYSKQIIEKARLNEMRKNGKILTKKQLSEMVVSEKLIPLLKSMKLFDVLDAFKDVYGDEKLQALSNERDILQGIVNVFYSSDDEKQQKFLTLLK